MNYAEVFYHAFLTALKESKLNIQTYQRGGQTFTDIMTRMIEKILAEQFDCKTSREYYRIDVTGWKGRHQEVLEEARQCRVNAHLWDLLVAVEHENDPWDWTDELIKLTHISCPLRVVIGYSPCDEREEGELRRLELAASWLMKTKAFSAGAGDFLLIFGNSAAVDREISYEFWDYRGYLFDSKDKKFVRISG